MRKLSFFKALIALLLIAAVLMAGCARSEPVAAPAPPPEDTAAPATTPPAATQAEESPPEAEPAVALQALAPAIHEFGEATALIENGEQFSAMVLYPACEFKAVNREIEGWAMQVMHDAIAEYEEMQAEDASVEGELHFTYNSYIVESAFAGIEEIGFYSHSHLAHPVDIIRTFNVDLLRGRIIPNEDLFDENQIPFLLSLLRDKLAETAPGAIDDIEMDESWLANPVLRPEGVAIHLERGYLPSALGRQEVLLGYDELGSALLLPESGAAPGKLYTTVEDPQIEVPEWAEYIQPDPAAPMLALTFDDGPGKATARILQLLAQYGGRATFFEVGNRMESKADLMRQILAQGSEIGSHSWDHKKLTGLSGDSLRADVLRPLDEAEAITGVRPTLMRPPYGSVNDAVKAAAREAGVTLINWSVDPEDWKTRSASATYDHILSHARDGAVILCHDIHEETGDAMERVIPALIEQGYQLVTVSELFAAKGYLLQPGELYRHAYE